MNVSYPDVQDIFTVSDTAIAEHLYTLLGSILFFLALFSVLYYGLKHVVGAKFVVDKETREEQIL